MDVGFFSSLVSVPAHPRIHRPTEGRREASSGGQVSHELFGPPVDHVHGRFGRLCRALPALAMILSAGLIVIIPLAYASPTDPTWVAGIYDAADYDEVLDVLTDSKAVRDFSSTAAVQPTVAVQPLSAVVARVACSSAAVSGLGVLLAFCLRSPPQPDEAAAPAGSGRMADVATPRAGRYLTGRSCFGH